MDEAEQSFRKALSLDSSNYEAVEWMVTLLAENNKTDQALTIVEPLKDSTVGKPLFSFRQHPFLLWVALLKDEQQMQQVRTRLKHVPNEAESMLWLGLALNNTGALDEAQKVFDNVITGLDTGQLSTMVTSPERVMCNALYKLAHIRYQKGEPEKALELYDRIVKISPFYADVQQNMGLCHTAVARRHLKDARESFEQAIQQNRRGRGSRIKESLDRVNTMLKGQ